MKIIEIIKNKTDESKYDDMLGHYRVVQEGLDDIVLIKNYEYREIKEVETSILGVKNRKYVVRSNINTDKYVVKPLDTLQSIAIKYNKSIEELKKKNHLSNEKLFIGQIIRL